MIHVNTSIIFLLKNNTSSDIWIVSVGPKRKH